MFLSYKFQGDNIEIGQALTEIYETVFGIFDHSKNANASPRNYRPLAGVAYHQAEDFTESSTMKDLMRTYSALPIYDLFKCTFDEWIRYPVYRARMMSDIAEEHRKKEEKKAEELDRTLGRGQIQGKQIILPPGKKR